MHLNSVKAHRGPVHTPLRYPGGKTRLTGFLRLVIEAGRWNDVTYVEPYAGGAGAALSLLHSDSVKRIVINDLDPCIHSFWLAVTHHPLDFLAKFDSAPLTIDEWKVQRDVYQSRDISNPVALGFATFYLNRTNRSGIMNAGVIGGQAQVGKYRIDARYNKKELRARIEWIAANADRIAVSNKDGMLLLEEVLNLDNTFCYIDPPYFDKGSFLYLNSFAEASHATLASLLHRARSGRWVLTYDDVAAIRALYLGLHQGTFALPYSAHKAVLAKERMVFSDSVAALDEVMS